MIALLTTVLLSTAPTASLVELASKAIVPPVARIEISEVQGRVERGCDLTSVEVAPISSSGRIAAKLIGARGERLCESWVWLQVHAFASVMIATRTIPEGASLLGATESVERELAHGRVPLTSIPERAVAARTLSTGTIVEASQVRIPELRPGTTINIVLRAGTLELKQPGRIISCGVGHSCAQLASGKRIEGRLEGSALIVEAL